MQQFLDILDRYKPDWWIIYATQQELIDCVRECTDGASRTVHAKTKLRRDVSNRLHMIAQAGVSWADQHKAETA
jgi:hypothetical protein